LGDEFKFSNYVIKNIRHKGMKNKWFADALKITESSFSYKIKNDSFTIIETLVLSDLLDINLSRVQEEYKNFKANNTEECSLETLEAL